MGHKAARAAGGGRRQVAEERGRPVRPAIRSHGALISGCGSSWAQRGAGRRVTLRWEAGRAGSLMRPAAARGSRSHLLAAAQGAGEAEPALVEPSALQPPARGARRFPNCDRRWRLAGGRQPCHHATACCGGVLGDASRRGNAAAHLPLLWSQTRPVTALVPPHPWVPKNAAQSANRAKCKPAALKPSDVQARVALPRVGNGGMRCRLRRHA